MCVWPKVEQRIEPARKAAQVLHKKLQGCMQSQPGLEAEKRMVAVLMHLRGLWKCSVSYWKCHMSSSLYRKSFLWCFCLSAWQKVWKTSMQSPQSGDRFDPLQLPIHPSIDQSVFCTWTPMLLLTLESCKSLMTVVWRFSSFQFWVKKERGCCLRLVTRALCICFI